MQLTSAHDCFRMNATRLAIPATTSEIAASSSEPKPLANFIVVAAC